MSDIGSDKNHGYISSRDAAKLYRVTHDHIARLARQGKIAGKLEGRNWMVERQSLADFFADRTPVVESVLPTYISSRDAAKLYRVTHDHIARLARQGKIAGKLEGRNWMVEVRSLSSFFNDRKVSLPAPAPKEVIYLPAPSKTIVPVAVQSTEPTKQSEVAPANISTKRRSMFVSLAAGIALLIASAGLIHAMAGYVAPSLQTAAAGRIESPFFGADIFGQLGSFFASLFAPKTAPQVAQQNLPAPTSAPAAVSVAATSTPTLPAPKETIVTNTYPVIERTVEHTVTNTVSGITQDYLNQQLNAIRSEIASISSGPSSPLLQYAPALRIDQLSGVAITGGSITGATISSGSISGVSLNVGDLSGVVATAHGGTGTSSAPAYGQLLLGNAAGGYDLVSTSSLGITVSGGINFAYLFPSNATTTQIAFNGGATFAGATTTALAVTGSTTIQTLNLTNALGVAFGGTGSTTLGGLLTGNGTGALTSATVSSPLSFSGNTLSIQQATASQNGYLATTDWNSFNSRLSTTTLGLFDKGYFFSTTSAAYWGSQQGYDTFAYLFPNNATTTLLNFSAGLTAYASSTIGDGTQIGGLTISGGATTTGNAYFAGKLAVGTQAPNSNYLAQVNGNLQSNAYILGTGPDLSLEPISGGQSALTSWWSLQLVGNKESSVIYTPSNVGVGVNAYGVVVPMQQTSAAGLAILGVGSQTGNYFEIASNANKTTTHGDVFNVAASGNVGIGTTSPYAKLSVGGDIVGTNLTATGTLAVSGLSIFNGGLTAYASSTIGDGTQTGGLTISGSATTTGNAYFAGTVGIGSSTPAGTLFAISGTTTIVSGNLSYGWTAGNKPATAQVRIGSNAQGTGLVITQASGGASGTLLGVYDQFGTSIFTVSNSAVNVGGSSRVGFGAGITSGPSLNTSGVSDYTILNTATDTIPAAVIVDNTDLSVERTTPLLRFSGASGNIPSMGYSTGGINAINDGTNRGLAFVSYDGSSFVENLRLLSNSRIGVGTTSPFAKFSIQASSTETNTTLFAIGSSTASATTTLFSISNTGSTTLAGIASSLLKVDAGGTIVAAVAGTDYATPSSLASAYPFQLAGNATSTLTQFNGGLTAFASSTVGDGTQTGGLTINGGATTTGTITSFGSILFPTTATGLAFRNTANKISIGADSTLGQRQGSWSTFFGTSNNTSSFTPAGGAEFVVNSGSGATQFNVLNYNGSAFSQIAAIGTASSTIGIGTQTGGLTISGGATTTGNAYFAGKVGIGTAVPATTLDVESASSGAEGGILTLKNSAAMAANNATGIGFATNSGTSYPNTNAYIQAVEGSSYNTSLTFGTVNTSLSTAIERMRIDQNGKVGIGTTSPFAKFAISANNGDTNTTLFAIGSSTANSTTTLFSVDNTGLATMLGGLTSYASSTIGDGTQRGGLTINGGATTTGNAYFSTANSTITGSTGLTLAETGDTFGDASLSIQNRNGVNGALFKNSSIDLVDFGFLPSSGVEQNIRLEHRGGATQFGNGNTGGEFQIGPAGAPNLVVGGVTTALLNGSFGIGTTTPGSALSVAGNIFSSGFVNTSGTTGGYEIDGNKVLYASTTNSALAVGASGAAAWMSASSTVWDSVAVGSGALAATPTSGVATNNTVVGFNAMNVNTTGYRNTAIGGFSLLHNTSGTDNVANGFQALLGNTTGNDNVGVGEATMYYNTTGSANFAGGFFALLHNNGNYNIGIGYSALSTNTTGSSNIAVGRSALTNNDSATSTVAIGDNAAVGTAAYNNQGGTYLGFQSGYKASTGSNYNTFLGYKTGFDVTTGANNIIIGQEQTTGNGITTSSGNIFIGNDLQLATSTGSQLNIGNLLFGTNLGSGSTLSTGAIGIGTTSPFAKFSIAANNGDTNTTLFAIGSSTANSTTTLFSVDNQGNTTVMGGLGVGVAANPNAYSLIVAGPISADSLADRNNGSYFVDPFGNWQGFSAIFGQNVGIGTTTAYGTKLVVNAAYGDTNSSLFVVSSSTTSGTNQLFSVDPSGNVISTLAASSTFAVGPNGATNPAFQIFAPTASSVTGLALTSKAAGSGVLLQTTSTGTNEGLTISSKGGSGLSLNGGGITLSANTGISNEYVGNNSVSFSWNQNGPSATSVYTFGDVLPYAQLSAGLEVPRVVWNINGTHSHSNGALALQREFLIKAPTEAFASYSVSNVITDTATLAVTGAPLTGANALTTNAYGLLIGSSTASTMYNASTTNSYGLAVFTSDGAQNTYAATFNGGNVGIGTTTPDVLLSVGSATPTGSVAHFENSTGSCYINPTTTSLSCTSDARLKKNVVTLGAPSGIAAIDALNPVLFNWNSEATGTPEHAGFIAQQAMQVFPDLVQLNPDGYYSLNYAGLTPYLTKAIQEQQSEITSIASSSATFAQMTIQDGSIVLGTGATSTVTLNAGQLTLGAASTSAITISAGTINMVNAATTTIAVGNGVWTIATSTATGTMPIISVSAPASSTPTVSINGTFVLNGQDVSSIASTSATTTPAALVQGPFASATTALQGAITTAYNAIQNIAQTGVRQLGAAVYAGVGTFGQLFTQKITTDTVQAHELCLDDVCVTGDQLQNLLNGQAASGSTSSTGTTSTTTTSTTSTSTSTPPTISINGNNPATVTVGTTYSDLGATATDVQGHSLTVHTFVNGAAMDPVVIDTSAAGSDTIDYVATDTWGNTATSTRTVNIVSATPTTTTTTTATSTSATTTAQ